MIGDLNADEVGPLAGNDLAAILQPHRARRIGGNQTNGLRQGDAFHDIGEEKADCIMLAGI